VIAISDLHGVVERLDVLAGGCDGVLVLGDLIDFLDYRNMVGILA